MKEKRIYEYKDNILAVTNSDVMQDADEQTQGTCITEKS